MTVPDEQRQIGERIAVARREAGLTQRELAQRLGVTARSIQNYESGAVVPYKHVRSIEVLAHKRIGWLLDGDIADDSMAGTVQRLERSIEQQHELLREHLETLQRQTQILKELREAADARRRANPPSGRRG